MQFVRWLLVLVCLMPCMPLRADQGAPLMQAWPRAELGSHFQNWKVAQGPNGLIYVGNGNRVLEYDGVQWRSYLTPQQSRIRDFAFLDQALYAGTISDLMRLEPDEHGLFRWVSLIGDWPQQRRQFGEIWQVETWGRFVVFAADEHLFVWDGVEVRDLPLPDGQLDLLAAAGGRLWVSNRKGELFHFQPAGMRLTQITRLPEGMRPRRILEWPDGRLLFISRHKGLWWWQNDRLEPVDSPDADLLAEAFLYDGVRLPGGGLALASIRAGLILLDERFNVELRLGREQGLFSDVQASVALDDQGGLWTVGENGLHRLHWPAPLTRILPGEVDSGNIGMVRLFRNEAILVGQGLFRLLPEAAGRPLRKSLIPGSLVQNWDLQPLNDREVLVARAGGIHLAEIGPDWQLRWQGQIQDMLFGTRIIASRKHPGRYYAFGTLGLVRIERDEGGTWRSHLLLKVRDMAHNMAEDAHGVLWVGTNIGRVYRVDPGDGSSEILDKAQGLPAGNVVPFWLDERLLIGTTQGLKVYRDGRFAPAPDMPAQLTSPEVEVYRILRDRSGQYWIRLARSTAILRPVSSGWQWDEKPLLAIPASVSVNFREDMQGRILLADGSGEVYLFDPDRGPVMPARPRLKLRGIRSQSNHRTLFGGVQPAGWSPAAVAPENNALRFEFALTRFLRNEVTQYRTRLLGMETEWTPWSRETRRDVTNLDAGEYILEIQARDIEGEHYTLRFPGMQVLPRWYESSTARAAYVLLALTLGYWLFRLGHRWRVHQLEREKARLSALVEMRTREVRRQARKLEEMNEAKSRFFANVSHEFRTPLTLTIGPLDTVCREHGDRLPDEVRRYLQLALANARRMLSLVGQILDMNRLEAGRMPLRVAQADLAAFLRQLAERFGPRMEQLGLRFETLGLEEPVLVYYDVDHLDKVVGNLLSNAAKFTPAGGQVLLALEVDGQQVTIRVRDSGPGVADEEKPLVFKRYYQSRRAGNVSEPGTGIGLALSRELVMLHHGRIHVQDAPDGGAEFVVELPRGKAHFDPDDLVQPDQVVLQQGGLIHEAPLELEQALSEPESRTLVLVVDDNRELRAFLRMRLEGEFRVMEAADGREALECMRREPPDVVVSDQMMPGMDGLQLVRAIRDDQELAGTPVLMLSAKTTHRDTVEGLQAGADDYLGKPFDTAELVVRIQALLAHRERIRQQMQRDFAREDDLPASGEKLCSEGARALLLCIREHLCDSGFSVENMAEHMAMERSTLYRNCREWFDCSPSELLRRERLFQAKRLLHQPDLTVAEVAYAVGFDSHAYFSRCFKQDTGLSPSQYRRQA